MLIADNRLSPEQRDKFHAWAKEQGEVPSEKDLEIREVEALERIAESLESIRSAQWIR